MTTNNKIPPLWQKLNSEPGPDYSIFRVRYDWLKNPRNHQELKRLVLETNDWVNIVALTPEQKIVVIRQYRFGTGKISAEIPGGIVDPGEEHQLAARRELQEETGFTSQKWRYLGPVEPNPAFLSNVCHQWLAEDAVQTHPPELDDGEDISVALLTLDEIKAEIQAGHFRHALALLALAHVFDLRR
jgi:8-oxo-dGTP pyrophosphatase MutT (NUDIX family)